jgi:hypothetical protein
MTRKFGWRPHLEQLEARNLLATWTPLTNLAPDAIGVMMLLPDGTVMAQDYGANFSVTLSSDPSFARYNQWFRLTPDPSGNYANGTWSSLASMSTQRLYYASNVLPSGKVFLVGGEYSEPTWMSPSRTPARFMIPRPTPGRRSLPIPSISARFLAMTRPWSCPTATS